MSPAAPPEPVLMHASCVATDERAVLILGPSGSGKSTLALALMGRGAELVADDQVRLTRRDGALLAAPPARLAGLIECRGVGLLRVAHRPAARVVLAVDLGQPAEVARMPQPRNISVTDVCLPLIAGHNRPNLADEVSAILRWGREPPVLDPEDPLDGNTR